MNGSLIQCFLFLACTLSDTPKINKHTFSKNVGTFYKKYADVLPKSLHVFENLYKFSTEI